MKLSINKLFEIAQKSNYCPILCKFLQPRCSTQLELLDLMAKKSKKSHVDSPINARRSLKNIKSLQRLYRDTLDFTLTIEKDQELDVRESKTLQISSRTKKFILNKFEFLEARHSTVVESFADIVTLIRYDDRDEDLISNFLHIQTSVAILLQHGFLLSSKKFYQQTGCVQYNCDLLTMCEGVIDHAINLAEHNVDGINRCPSINIHLDQGEGLEVNENMWGVDCIPSSVRFVLLELLKNAISSTLLQNGTRNISLPPIDVILRSTNTHIIVYVHDRGTGLRGRTLHDLSKFVCNVNTKEAQLIQASYQPQSASLSGMGAGLGVSIVWATKFGGELELHDGESLELNGLNSSKFGFGGVTAKFSIPKDVDIEENLVFNIESKD